MRQLFSARPRSHSVGGRYSVGRVGSDLVGLAGPGLPAMPNLSMLTHMTPPGGVGMPPALPPAASGSYPLAGRLPYGTPVPHFAPSRPRQVKRIMLGFGTTTVAASATVPLTSRPQKWFQPERLYIPASQGTNFQINDIKVGNVSMYLNTNAGGSVMFVENATDGAVTFDTADPAIDVSIVVQNLDGANSHAITPTMVGIAAI